MKERNAKEKIMGSVGVLIPTIIFILAFLQYANTLGHDYAWDDKLVITENPYTLKGLDGLKEIWTLRAFTPKRNNYRPVVQTTFALEVAAFGLKPFWGHLGNVLLYAGTCVLIWFFVTALFPLEPVWGKILTTLIFLVHPLHVEVVANIKSRDEILALFFGLAALISFLRWCNHLKSWPWLLASIGFWLLALLSKFNAVTLLPVFALVFYYKAPKMDIRPFLGGSLTLLFVLAGVVLQAPVLVFAAVFPAMAWAWVWRKSIGISSTLIGLGLVYLFAVEPNVSPGMISNVYYKPDAVNNILYATGSGQYLPTSLKILGVYLKLFLWPLPLVHLSGAFQYSLSDWTHWRVYLALISLLAIIAGGVWGGWRKRPFSFGLLFFLFTISIYSNLVELAPDTFADRYAYMASLGFALFVGLGLGESPLAFWATLNKKFPLTEQKKKAIRIALGILMAAVLLTFSFFTFRANRDWKDTDTLMKNRIGLMENNALAQLQYGRMLFHQVVEGEMTVQKRQLLAAAILHCQKAVSIYPPFYEAHEDLAKMLVLAGRAEEGLRHFEIILAADPTQPGACFGAGKLLFDQDQTDRALPLLQSAYAGNPDNLDVYPYLAWAYIKTGEFASALEVLEAGNDRFPESSQFATLAAFFYKESGDLIQAQGWAQIALDKNPADSRARSILESVQN